MHCSNSSVLLELEEVDQSVVKILLCCIVNRKEILQYFHCNNLILLQFFCVQYIFIHVSKHYLHIFPWCLFECHFGVQSTLCGVYGSLDNHGVACCQCIIHVVCLNVLNLLLRCVCFVGNNETSQSLRYYTYVQI